MFTTIFSAIGETYLSDDDVLWWAKGGTLHGESPERIAFLKDFMYGLEDALEPWSEPMFEEFNNVTEQIVPGELPPFVQLMQSLTPEESENLKWKSAAYTGHYKENIYLKYFGNQRPRVAAIRLPKEHFYKVEMIDVWDMTRTVVEEKVSGKVLLTLPGKEGIAVLATRVNQ